MFGISNSPGPTDAVTLSKLIANTNAVVDAFRHQSISSHSIDNVW